MHIRGEAWQSYNRVPLRRQVLRARIVVESMQLMSLDQTPAASGAADAVERGARSECELLRKIQALLERLRTTTEMLLPQRSLGAAETEIGSNTPNSSNAARQRSAHRRTLWTSLREDASELHSTLSAGHQTSRRSSASLSMGAEQGRTSSNNEAGSHESRTEQRIDLSAADWGGLEEFFPELQHSDRPQRSAYSEEC